jgi:hypothetical protein
MGAGLHDACGAESERRYDFAEDQRVVARVEQQINLKHKHKRKHISGRAGRGGVSAAQPTGPHVMQAAEIRAFQEHHELRQRLKHDVIVPVWQHRGASPRWADGPCGTDSIRSMGLQRHSRVSSLVGIRIADWPIGAW